MVQETKMLTVEQVAGQLQVNRDVVYRLLKNGRLRGIRLGGRKTGWRISEVELARFVRESEAKAS